MKYLEALQVCLVMVLIRPDLFIQNIIKVLSHMLGVVNDFVARCHMRSSSDMVKIPVPRA